MEYLIPHFGSTQLVYEAVASIVRTDQSAAVYIGDDTCSLTDADLAPFVVTIIPGPQKGFASNVNNLVRHATGEWVTILNNDVVLSSRWWRYMQEHIREQNERTFSIASTVVRPDGLIDSLGDALSWYGIGFNRFHLKKIHPNYLRASRILGATGGLAVLRRQLFLELGGYSETLQSYCEDTQLNIRANAAGYVSVYYPDPVAVHRGTSTFSVGKKYYQSARNSALYIRMDFANPLRARMLRRVSAYWRMKALLSRRHRNDILAGLLAGFREPVTTSSIAIHALPKGACTENFGQSQIRLLSQFFISVGRRLRLLRSA